MQALKCLTSILADKEYAAEIGWQTNVHRSTTLYS